LNIFLLVGSRRIVSTVIRKRTDYLCSESDNDFFKKIKLTQFDEENLTAYDLLSAEEGDEKSITKFVSVFSNVGLGLIEGDIDVSKISLRLKGVMERIEEFERKRIKNETKRVAKAVKSLRVKSEVSKFEKDKSKVKFFKDKAAAERSEFSVSRSSSSSSSTSSDSDSSASDEEETISTTLTKVKWTIQPNLITSKTFELPEKSEEYEWLEYDEEEDKEEIQDKNSKEEVKEFSREYSTDAELRSFYRDAVFSFFVEVVDKILSGFSANFKKLYSQNEISLSSLFFLKSLSLTKFPFLERTCKFRLIIPDISKMLIPAEILRDYLDVIHEEIIDPFKNCLTGVCLVLNPSLKYVKDTFVCDKVVMREFSRKFTKEEVIHDKNFNLMEALKSFSKE
jgi:hypothetical protein